MVTAPLRPRGTKPSSAWCKTSRFWFTSSSKRDFRWEGWLLHPNPAFICKVSAPSGYQQTQLPQATVGQLSCRLLHINELYSLAWGCVNHLSGFYPPLETNRLTKERLSWCSAVWKVTATATTKLSILSLMNDELVC